MEVEKKAHPIVSKSYPFVNALKASSLPIFTDSKENFTYGRFKTVGELWMMPNCC
ncbi:hypothetical protein IAD21_04978 [Abditibacteriota bacterium]|nr:hypothetical protein IAD21_04978 [Abditibacteriota bacterium]